MDVHVETTINVPPDLVWQILGHRFADIAEWSAFVIESRAITDGEVPPQLQADTGAPVPGRWTKTRLELTEVVTMYTDAEREFIFQAVGLPPIVKSSQNHSRVRPQGPGQSLVSFDVQMELKGVFKIFAPLMRGRLEKGLGGILQELKRYAESRPAI